MEEVILKLYHERRVDVCQADEAEFSGKLTGAAWKGGIVWTKVWWGDIAQCVCNFEVRNEVEHNEINTGWKTAWKAGRDHGHPCTL